MITARTENRRERERLCVCVCVCTLWCMTVAVDDTQFKMSFATCENTNEL